MKTGMVVGTAKGGVWSQVSVVGLGRAQLLILLRLEYSGEGELVEVAEIGGALLESLKTVVTAPVGLEELENKVSGVAEELGEGLSAEIVVVVIAEGEQEGEQAWLTGVGRGGGELYLVRGERLSRLLTKGEERVRGQILPGDELVLTTKEAAEVISEGGWGGLNNPEELEKLAVRVHARDDSSGVAVLVGKLAGTRKDERLGKGIEWGRVVTRVRAWGRRPVKIREEQRRQNILVGAGLTILLLVGVGVGVVRRGQVVRRQAYEQVAQLVSGKLDEAGSIADLNPERARVLLLEVKGEIESYLSETTDKEYLAKGEKLREAAERAEGEILRRAGVEVVTLVETELLGLGETLAMDLDENGNLLVVDTGGKVAGINVGDRSSWQVGQGDLRVRDMAVGGGRVYLLADDGVWEVAGGEVNRVIEADELWSEARRVETYGGNVYVLDGGQGEIWKYPALTGEFGDRRRWFGAGIVLDLSKVANWEVDGDIWLVTESGKLERYSLGVPVEYTLEGFPAIEGGRLMAPAAVVTGAEEVLVLEAGAKRVVVADRESGRYERQLVNEAFGAGRELVVDEKRGYVLLPDRIVWFELK